MEHHPDGPSTLERRINCPASAQVERLFPEEKSEIGDRGTNLHTYLQHLDKPLDDLSVDDRWNVESAREQLQMLIDNLEKAGHKILRVDHEIKIDIYLDIDTYRFGTADILIGTDKGLLIADYKSGYKPIESNAVQNKAYCLGACQMFNNLSGVVYSALIQPSESSTPDVYETSYKDLEDYFVDVLAEMRAFPDRFNAGPWCDYCRNRNNCQTLMIKTQTLSAEGCSPIAKQIDLDTFLDNYSVVKKTLEGYYNEAKQMVIDGHSDLYVANETKGNKKVEDIQALYESLEDFITYKEFISACKVSLTAVRDISHRKLQEQLEKKGEKVTLKECLTRIDISIDEFISRGAGHYRIKKKI